MFDWRRLAFETMVVANFVKVTENETLPLQFSLLTEIDEIADLLSCDTHVIEQLSFVVRAEFLQRLQFDNYFPIYKQVWSILCG